MTELACRVYVCTQSSLKVSWLYLLNILFHLQKVQQICDEREVIKMRGKNSY